MRSEEDNRLIQAATMRLSTLEEFNANTTLEH